MRTTLPPVPALAEKQSLRTMMGLLLPGMQLLSEMPWLLVLMLVRLLLMLVVLVMVLMLMQMVLVVMQVVLLRSYSEATVTTPRHPTLGGMPARRAAAPSLCPWLTSARGEPGTAPLMSGASR